MSMLTLDCEIAFPPTSAVPRDLDRAESKRYEVLITVDQGLEYQQNLLGRKIAVNRTRSTRACARLFGASGILKVRANRENPQLELKGV
jgi:hypothetical protein